MVPFQTREYRSTLRKESMVPKTKIELCADATVLHQNNRHYYSVPTWSSLYKVLHGPDRLNMKMIRAVRETLSNLKPLYSLHTHPSISDKNLQMCQIDIEGDKIISLR